MRLLVLIITLFSTTSYAKPIAGLSDYGVFLSPNKFTTYCVITDNGLSGNSNIVVYSNGQIVCTKMQEVFNETYRQLLGFLKTTNYNTNIKAPRKNIIIRIITLADLNNPENFSNTEAACMKGRIRACKEGAFVGRTFYIQNYDNINIYIGYNNYHDKYGFIPTIKHELMHAILYRYGWHYLLNDKEEHNLIDKFLDWTESRNNTASKTL